VESTAARLFQALDTLRRHPADLDTWTATVYDLVTQLKLDALHVSETNKTLETKIKSLLQHRKSTQHDIQLKNTRIESIESQLSQLQSQNEELITALKSEKASVRTLRQRVEEHKSELVAYRDENDRQSTALQAATERVITLQRREHELITTVDRHETLIGKFAAEYVPLSRYEDVSASKVAAEKDRDECYVLMAELEAELEKVSLNGCADPMVMDDMQSQLVAAEAQLLMLRHDLQEKDALLGQVSDALRHALEENEAVRIDWVAYECSWPPRRTRQPSTQQWSATFKLILLKWYPSFYLFFNIQSEVGVQTEEPIKIVETALREMQMMKFSNSLMHEQVHRSPVAH
jgi:myosin heavy subunit